VRILLPLVAFAAVVAAIVVELFAQPREATWAVPLAILVAGGFVVTAGVVLRNAVAAAPMRRRKLPSDPGFPRAPLGSPYRGP
jgi:hypothetical protein